MSSVLAKALVFSLALLVVFSGFTSAQPRLSGRSEVATATPSVETVAFPGGGDGGGLWTMEPVEQLGAKQLADPSSFDVAPGFYAVAALDEHAMRALLDLAPMEFTAKADADPILIQLPMPGGAFGRFTLVESPIMEPQAAAEFSEIRTFVGQGVDDPTATMRADLTPLGFHAQVLSAGGTVYVDPFRAGDTSRYIAYDKRGLAPDSDPMQCLVDDVADDVEEDGGLIRGDGAEAAAYTNGGTLRTYRLAQACTGEYATAVCNHNGVSVTVANTMAAITTTINRVTGIYERELSIRLVLVGNNSQVVYTTASTDPYTNDNPSALLSQNTSTCNSRIGSANYDIGHVFSTGGGGLAGLGVVCGSRKAEGETGSGSPWGDAFDVDYVAHEMGHQFGGNHTFIGTSGSCSGNGNASTAYERGSGSTIQAYAGICGTQNLQPNSDDYFHSISLNEMSNYMVGGGACSANTATGNTTPSLPALTSYTGVPVSTNFTLTAPVATDANGDTLTYTWEDWNTGSAALFRPVRPTTSRSRTFGNVANPTSGNIAWEALPTSATTKTFRCTVRDNRAGGGAYTSATMTVQFVAGAFSVTAPNTAVSWAGNSSQTVTWAKGGSTAANVAIELSTNGGSAWTTLLASTPNDGSQAITVPNTPSTTCRIRVRPTDNVYFDDSNVNFTITSGGSCSYSISPTSASPAAAASTGSVSVTAGTGCAWTAVSNTTSWLTVTSGASGSGNGTVGWSAAANTGAARTGTITIAGQTFTVNQAAGSGCSSGNSAITVNAAASSGSLATTDCTTTSGNNNAGAYYDNFTFSATAGTAYTIVMNSSAFDTYLRLYNGTTLLTSDDDGNGGTNSKIVYTASSSGTLTIRSTSYSPGSTGAYTVQVTGGSAPELVTNGGFESTTSGWTFATYSTVTTGSPFAGTYKAQQLGRGTTTSTNFWQTISGFNGTAKTLRFYLKISSAEGTSTAYDYLRVRIYNSSGALVSTLGTYTNVNKNTYVNWVQVTLSIPASAAAANNRIRFDASEDSSLQTTFFIDNVSIQ